MHALALADGQWRHGFLDALRGGRAGGRQILERQQAVGDACAGRRRRRSGLVASPAYSRPLPGYITSLPSSPSSLPVRFFVFGAIEAVVEAAPFRRSSEILVERDAHASWAWRSIHAFSSTIEK